MTGVADQQPKRGTDWTAARDFWLALDPPRSSQPVADQFQVSRTRVNFVRKRDGWDAIAAEIDAKALSNVKDRLVLSREERNAKFLQIVDLANKRAFDKLTADQLEVRLADLPALGKHAELILGEATDRVSFAELQEALGVVIALAIAELPKKARAAFLKKVRARLGAIGDGE